MPDAIYASYGWWLHKSEDDSKGYTASAFVDDGKGAVRRLEGIQRIAGLRGTATYVGGAAGKYALSSSTGGTNDAGHFTAKATLEADFNVDHDLGHHRHLHGSGWYGAGLVRRVEEVRRRRQTGNITVLTQ